MKKQLKINYKELKDKVYNYPTKYPQGFIQSELDELLKEYPNINMGKFNNATIGNTCMFNEEDGLIQYHCDIYKAIVCGIEGRELYPHEVD